MPSDPVGQLSLALYATGQVIAAVAGRAVDYADSVRRVESPRPW